MTTVNINSDAVDTALEELEEAMEHGEMSLSHDEVRPSTHLLAHKTRDAYRTLVTAHPDYDLTDEEGEE